MILLHHGPLPIPAVSRQEYLRAAETAPHPEHAATQQCDVNPGNTRARRNFDGHGEGCILNTRINSWDGSLLGNAACDRVVDSPPLLGFGLRAHVVFPRWQIGKA